MTRSVSPSARAAFAMFPREDLSASSSISRSTLSSISSSEPSKRVPLASAVWSVKGR